MLKVRVIPCLDVKDGRVVKGVNFEHLRDAGDPVEQAVIYDRAGADELCFLDITASHEGRGTLLDVVRRTAEVCFMPLTVGGGVRTLEDIRALLLAGADNVSINSAAVARPGICPRSGKRNSAANASLPPLTPKKDEKGFEIFTHGGRARHRHRRHRPCAGKMVDYGAGEILLTSMDRDGTKAGYDLPLTRAICDAVSVPVIASGGVGKVEDLVQGVTEGHASAVLAASIFHFGEVSIEQAKAALAAAGLPVRPL